jgi:hypothetical protein
MQREMSHGWLVTLGIVGVAICAGLAAMGFKGRITSKSNALLSGLVVVWTVDNFLNFFAAVGIDLGTTFSVVGINKNGQVIIIEDQAKNRIFPSVVSYQPNGEILVAYEAVKQLSQSPQNTIYNAKRFMGRSLEEVDVQTYANDHPYKVVPSTASKFSKVSDLFFFLEAPVEWNVCGFNFPLSAFLLNPVVTFLSLSLSLSLLLSLSLSLSLSVILTRLDLSFNSHQNPRKILRRIARLFLPNKLEVKSLSICSRSLRLT